MAWKIQGDTIVNTGTGEVYGNKNGVRGKRLDGRTEPKPIAASANATQAERPQPKASPANDAMAGALLGSGVYGPGDDRWKSLLGYIERSQNEEDTPNYSPVPSDDRMPEQERTDLFYRPLGASGGEDLASRSRAIADRPEVGPPWRMAGAKSSPEERAAILRALVGLKGEGDSDKFDPAMLSAIGRMR